MYRLLVLAPAAALITGCMPSVHLQMLEPADVFVPLHIERIAVADRSAPPDGSGGRILAVAEGLLTGEGIMEDRQGATQALAGVVDGLAASPRFDVTRPNVSLEGSVAGMMADPLRWKRVNKICDGVDAQALLLLEAFDSDSWVTVEPLTEIITTEAGKEVEIVTFAAQRETTVTLGWRLYDPSGKVIVDHLKESKVSDTWRHEEDTAEAAQNALPSQALTVHEVGREAGQTYARRIAPGWVQVTRRYYAKGHPTLVEARSLVDAGKWRRAAKQWRTLLDHEDPKIRGRAHFNLALALERAGQLEQAKVMAKKAVSDLDNRKAHAYLAILKQRIVDQARVDRQMGESDTP